MSLLTQVYAAVFAIGIVGPVAYGAMEPFPFTEIKVTIDPVTIKPDMEVRVRASLFVLKQCPYMVERRLFDGDANRVFDQRFQTGEPFAQGDIILGAPFRLDATPVPGVGLYQVRIGAMCNWVQRAFPNWSKWIETKVLFTEEKVPPR